MSYKLVARKVIKGVKTVKRYKTYVDKVQGVFNDITNLSDLNNLLDEATKQNLIESEFVYSFSWCPFVEEDEVDELIGVMLIVYEGIDYNGNNITLDPLLITNINYEFFVDAFEASSKGLYTRRILWRQPNQTFGMNVINTFRDYVNSYEEAKQAMEAEDEEEDSFDFESISP